MHKVTLYLDFTDKVTGEIEQLGDDPFQDGIADLPFDVCPAVGDVIWLCEMGHTFRVHTRDFMQTKSQFKTFGVVHLTAVYEGRDCKESVLDDLRAWHAELCE